MRIVEWGKLVIGLVMIGFGVYPGAWGWIYRRALLETVDPTRPTGLNWMIFPAALVLSGAVLIASAQLTDKKKPV